MKPRRQHAWPAKAQKPASGSDARRCRVRLKPGQFARDEAGVLYVFGIYVFVLILMIGGIGVDLMRFERDRSKLQYTLDRAVLAAADLDQPLDPESVVEDYFDKAGLAQYLGAVTVDQGASFREVSAVAEAEIETQFMHMTGVDTLQAPAASTAEERIGAVEISLVLDMSGSMNSNSRLVRLKPAARDFVDAILNNAEEGRASISIIPFATQVNAGKKLLDKFVVTDEHQYSHCVNFLDFQFSTTELDRYREMERTAHFDPFTYSENMISFPVCPTRAGSEILPLSNDRDELHAFINSLTPKGNTSIDIGVKWGTALLDPSLQSVVSELVDDEVIIEGFRGRPTNYNDGDTLKVVVVMSDGENTDQYMLNPSMREGMSDVWYNAEEGRYSVYHDNGSTKYYWPHKNSWQDHPYGAGTYEECNSYKKNGVWYKTCTEHDEPGNAVRMSYPELFAQVSLAWNAEYNYEFTSSAWAEWYYSAFSKKEASAKNQRTKHICGATKDQGVIVFTIGFEAPQKGQRILEDCASSAAHHFDVEGLEIADAFESIASSIRKLRLTQ